MLLNCRIREMVDLVFDTIREPKRIVDVPVAVGKLLAAPRERFFKSVGIQTTHRRHAMHALMYEQCHLAWAFSCDDLIALLAAPNAHSNGQIGLTVSRAEQVPIPVNYLFTADNIIENTQDHILPPNVLTFKDLGIEPSKVTEGFPIEHLRHYRVGGYDFGASFPLSALLVHARVVLQGLGPEGKHIDPSCFAYVPSVP